MPKSITRETLPMPDEKTRVFEQNRRTLEGIAYRMLGTLSEASDVVQDTYIKWNAVDMSRVDNSRAWLITVCRRLAINTLQSARVKRERYVGLWLPEPYVDSGDDMSASLELDESVSVALLVAMEKLSPTERASYLLHEVFDYSFDEIAQFIGKNSANCRQHASRARHKLQQEKPAQPCSAAEHQALLQRFILAAEEGDITPFQQLLAETVELYTDGGGKVAAIMDKLSGSVPVSRFFIGIWRQFGRSDINVETVTDWFNGSPGILVLENNRIATAMTIDIHEGRVQRIYAVRNPEKLGGLLRDCRA